ncbi:GroES-like protein [Auricularia subglabra TFB-10046 SS5]|nr:GroES-like protein [Auricularia subglabra TFB-10046 SS5]
MTETYKTTKALALTARKDIDSLTIIEQPVPDLAANEILIANVAVAQNPVDWKQIVLDFGILELPWTHGCDVAGRVVRVGSAVTKFKAGDRVISYLQRRTARHGGYQTLSIADEAHTTHLPEKYTFEQGATVPAAFVTAAAGLEEGLSVDLATPITSGEPLLVWGGSSSVGAFVIQLAAQAGYRVLATASPANHAYVKSLGAAEVFDYHDSNVVEQIRKAAGPSLSRVYDAISENGSIEASAASITSTGGGTVNIILGISDSVADTLPKNVKIASAGARLVAQSADVREKAYSALNGLLQSGKLIPNTVKIIPGGLNGVKDGLLLAKAGKVSGQKLVYRIAETKV